MMSDRDPHERRWIVFWIIVFLFIAAVVVFGGFWSIGNNLSNVTG